MSANLICGYTISGSTVFHHVLLTSKYGKFTRICFFYRSNTPIALQTDDEIDADLEERLYAQIHHQEDAGDTNFDPKINTGMYQWRADYLLLLRSLA